MRAASSGFAIGTLLAQGVIILTGGTMTVYNGIGDIIAVVLLVVAFIQQTQENNR